MPPQVPKAGGGGQPVVTQGTVQTEEPTSPNIEQKPAQPPKQDAETAAKNAKAARQHANDTKSFDSTRGQLVKDQLAKKLPENNTPPADLENKRAQEIAKTGSSKISDSSGAFGPGKKVLMLGDSHTVMGYGKKMKELIKSTGSDVNVDAKVGARPKDFPDRIAEHIRKENPDTIVVSLGTNFRESKMTQAQVNVQVERITKAVKDAGSNAKIIWVGPPRLKEDMKDNGASLDSFDKMMEKAMSSKGQYVSSNPYTTYKGRDGVHYENAQAEAWAKGIFDNIQSRK
jgi:hypothetical protein